MRRAEGSSLSCQRTRRCASELLPITFSAGDVYRDCSISEGEPTPIYRIDSHDWDIDGATKPKTRSFGELVIWWTDAPRDGAWQWLPDAGRWTYRRKQAA